MTKQEAWNIIAQATAAVQANREVHTKISEALKVLKPEDGPVKEGE